MIAAVTFEGFLLASVVLAIAATVLTAVLAPQDNGDGKYDEETDVERRLRRDRRLPR